MTPPGAAMSGQTTGFPNGPFDGVVSEVWRGMSSDALAASRPWQSGLRLYRERNFREAHRRLRAVWSATEAGSPERQMVAAVMQLANAALEGRLGRQDELRRLCDLAAAHLAHVPVARGFVLGLSVEWVQNEVAALHVEMQDRKYNAYLDVGGV
ncbi:MAG: hypothetical protein AAGK37_18040 [Pseudomonadota bacterium]